jgi:hypothetical protein
MCQIATDQLDAMKEWISELRIAWEKHLDHLDEYLKKHAKGNQDER